MLYQIVSRILLCALIFAAAYSGTTYKLSLNQQQTQTSQHKIFDSPSSLKLYILTSSFDHAERVCSATVISDHVFLSATHCFIDETNNKFIVTKIWANDKLMDYGDNFQTSVSFDDSDHILIHVNSPFLISAKLGTYPDVGDNIHYWGNPANITNMYRYGYVAYSTPTFTALDINGFMGDSGAGLFNENGELVGMIANMYPIYETAVDTNGNARELSIKFMGIKHFTFTSENLNKVELDSKLYKNLLKN